MDAVLPGSYLAVDHLTADIYPEMADFARSTNSRQPASEVLLRDHAEVSRFFDGLDLVEPGVVKISHRHPRSELEARAHGAL
jgi:hypothetical protein